MYKFFPGILSLRKWNNCVVWCYWTPVYQ